MRWPLPLVAVACLAACGRAPSPADLGEADVTASGEPVRAVDLKTRGRVIDTAEILTPIEEKAIGARLAALRENQKRAVVIVTLVPSDGDSMERVGWAVGSRAAEPKPLLLLIDAKAATVRIEGNLAPTSGASVAAAMQPDLKDERYGAAIGRGLDRLQAILS